MTTLPETTLARLQSRAEGGHDDARVLLHLIARADKRDQDVAVFIESYFRIRSAICRRLEALERAAGPIDARRYVDLRERTPAPTPPPADPPEWQPCVKLPITVHVREQRPGETHSSTREGITPLRPDDLIMRGVQGEEYPIGRELFNQTYRMGVALAQPEGEGPGDVGELLTNNGVFKGAHGIEGLLSADAFWEQQLYGTRLYYGDGNADYLHRDVLRSAVTLLQRLTSPDCLVVGRPPEGFLDLLKSEPGEIQVCTAGVSIEPLGDAAHPTFQDAINLAEGCHDYSGGYSGTEGEAWHGAIGTVVDVLKRAAIEPWDSQLKAVYGVGVEAQAGEVRA